MHPVHHALSIKDPKELQRFYTAVLLMEEASRRTLPQELSREIFGKDRATEFYLYKKDSLLLELFLDPTMTPPGGYSHLCFSVSDRDALIKRATAAGYPVTHIPRSGFDLFFIRDASGNLFEIKEITEEA